MNRAIVAQRASKRPVRRTAGRPGTNILARTLTEVDRAVPAHRGRKSPRLTAVQKNSEGRRSEWSRSPYFWTDPKWGA